MTADTIYDFNVTVVPPAGWAPSTHKVRAATASRALILYNRNIAQSQIRELCSVARAMFTGTIYIAAPTNPKPVATAPEPDPKTGIQKWELEG